MEQFEPGILPDLPAGAIEKPTVGRIDALIARALRWRMQDGPRKIGPIKYTDATDRVEFVLRPRSGEAVSIDWQVSVGSWRVAGVRQVCRNEDLEFTIAGTPYGSIDGKIEFHEPVKIKPDALRFPKVQNIAPNPRTMKVLISVWVRFDQGPSFRVIYEPNPLRAGETCYPGPSESPIPIIHVGVGEVEMLSITWDMFPVGDQFLMRLRGPR